MQTPKTFHLPSKSLLNSSRHLLRHEIQSCINYLNAHIQSLSVLSFIQHKEENKLPQTFYENRYGFSNKDLKDCGFNKLGLFNYSRLLQNGSTYQQIRGFKTKRQLKESDHGSFSDRLKARLEENPFEAQSNALNNLLKSSSSSKKLGSIFQDSNSRAPMDDKVKTAFAEGILYADKQKTKPSIFRFIFTTMIFTSLLTLGFTLFQNASGKENGKGSTGISISSITGTKSFEVDPENVTTKFDDVKGLPEAKQELLQIVDFLKDPEKYTKLGARLPKGVLLVGPPGCGKTLLAKSVAGEAGVPFFQASGSDFDEMFVGTGSKRVRGLFAAARAKAPCVIFIDEIDSVGSKRSNSSVHPHANQTINQLLAEMDGFQNNEGVIVLGATNRRDALDPALMRPGRFDVEVAIDRPDLKQRIEILGFYLEKVAADPKIDVKYLAKQLNRMGGSSIENVVNQAALRAVACGSSIVKMEHLEYALDKTLMGYGKARLVDEQVNKNTAYHEAGHVLIAYYTQDSNPLHKVTMLPRAKSLGHTAFVPEDDVYSMTKSQLLAQMDVLMGGRVAEELIFGKDKVTTGASSDFQRATEIAQEMVKTYGMNETVGIRYMNGRESSELSPQSQDVLDQEIKKYLDNSYSRAKHILSTHGRELKVVAEALLEKETLDADQIKKLLEH